MTTFFTSPGYFSAQRITLFTNSNILTLTVRRIYVLTVAKGTWLKIVRVKKYNDHLATLAMEDDDTFLGRTHINSVNLTKSQVVKKVQN